MIVQFDLNLSFASDKHIVHCKSGTCTSQIEINLDFIEWYPLPLPEDNLWLFLLTCTKFPLKLNTLKGL